MAPIENKPVKSRCGDGVDFDLINKVQEDVSSESKPPAAFVPYPSDGKDRSAFLFFYHRQYKIYFFARDLSVESVFLIFSYACMCL